MLVAQSRPTLGDPTDRQGSSVHGILQARTLEWVAIPSPGDPPDPGTELASPSFQVDFSSSEPSGKPKQMLMHL